MLEGLDAAHAAHTHVEKNEIRCRPFLHHRDPLLAARGLSHEILSRGQHAGK